MSASNPEAQPQPGKKRTRRRRLRSRIIWSFFLMGLGLTLLFAYATEVVRTSVQNQLLEDTLNKNIAAAARTFAETGDPNIAPEVEVEQMRAFIYPPSMWDSVRNNRPEWAALDDGIHPMIGTDEHDNPSPYMLAVRKTHDAWFFLAYDTAKAVSAEQRIQQALLFAVVLFGLLSLLLGWWSASKVMSPVTDLAKRLRKAGSSSDPEQLAPFFADDEVGELAKALDDYSERLTDVVQRDREFNADVSHELRTPLAVIRSATELLLSQDNLDEKTRQRLLRIQRAQQNGTDLTSALLQLSRNERVHGATDVARVAEHLLDAHRSQLRGKSLVLRLEGEPGLIVDAPEAAVSVALGNLIGNAVKYTPSGEVVVRLVENAAQVIDTGPGLSEEEAARLFERGYRGAHAEHTHGGGIGLSIVRRLCDLYGWHVRVVPGAERGVIATLSFVDTPAP
ncbi:two-component sensor histidine kinase [Lysobacteraceae bacterium NML120232]|nr:two-component sensor histidine kinase [Xanthomonadaceae bacterium NML08-0793]PJK11649.1 two-component sensor histidine kinase [Xanthomonadaceae bacterium NML120232]